MDIHYGFWKHGNLSQEFHVHFLCSWTSTSMTKNMTALTTTRAFEIAHILNQTHYLQPSPFSQGSTNFSRTNISYFIKFKENLSSNNGGAWSTWSHISTLINKGTHRNINFAKHVCSPACIYQCNILRCRDYHCSCTPQATERSFMDHNYVWKGNWTNKIPVSTPLSKSFREETNLEFDEAGSAEVKISLDLCHESAKQIITVENAPWCTSYYKNLHILEGSAAEAPTSQYC